MRCPFCGHADTAVKDSRSTDDQTTIRRRRFCGECASRFTTLERVQLRDLRVIKKNGTLVPFDRDKLARSINTALHKRPITMEQIERITNSLMRQLETTGESEIPTTTIGEMVLQALFNLDHVAYLRFASVYQDFSSIDDFISFISQLSEPSADPAAP